ncbi:MAG: hypothetical protein WA840_12830 [Caulobacteraceae bacterium]
MIWLISILKVALAGYVDRMVTVSASLVFGFLLSLEITTFIPIDHDYMVCSSGILVGAFGSVFDIRRGHMHLPISNFFLE